MNESSNVGVSFGGSLNGGYQPLTIQANDIRRVASETGDAVQHVLLELNEAQKAKLYDHLKSRLDVGVNARNKRSFRYSRIDRTISTWQKLGPEDSERERIEDSTGRQAALPMNLPVLASHLNDMASYFAEALAPVSNPFFSSTPEGQAVDLLKKFNRDAAARDYYGQLNLTLRSLLKYNIGGFHMSYQAAGEGGNSYSDRQPGVCWESLDVYNTFWDPAVKNPKDVAGKAEWAATVCIENRLALVRNSLDGKWVGLEELIERGNNTTQTRYYKNVAYTVTYGNEGQDQRTQAGSQQPVNWDSYGLGMTSDLGQEIDGFEVVNMYCWLIPAQFGLLTDAERKLLNASSRPVDTFLELWRFTIVDDKVVDAEPAVEREYSIANEVIEIPMYMSFMTADQLQEAQRSFMELMRGFQRFGSAMYNIYIAGMRKNVWGVTGVDTTMFDVSKLKQGDTVGVLESKLPGRDVRTGITALASNAGVDEALKAIDSTLAMKDKFFPSQALPSQLAGIDRAVKSQVATVVQGAQRSLRTLLRALDSTLMLPTRLCAFRSYKRYDSEGIDGMNDEQVAKMVGSGIESMEAERVSQAIWQLIYAIIQNQEAMQVFDVPKLMTYASRVDNLSVDLGSFVRQPTQPIGAPPGAAPPPEGQPPALPAQ